VAEGWVTVGHLGMFGVSVPGFLGVTLTATVEVRLIAEAVHRPPVRIPAREHVPRRRRPWRRVMRHPMCLPA
jgi:hypothetical protein